MRIIPAIDIIDGKCVRLSKGDYDTQKLYNENPVEIAKAFEDAGIEYLHVVDLDGAKAKRIINDQVVRSICAVTNLSVDFGGGVQSDEDIEKAFDCGVNQITGGSIAVNQPELFLSWLERYGSERIILGADCRDGKVATHGWMETSELDVIPFIQSFEDKGIHSVICTDIAKDGMLQGPSIELYGNIMNETSIGLIASGGITSMDDLKNLRRMGCEGAIIGKALYEGNITLKELSTLC